MYSSRSATNQADIFKELAVSDLLEEVNHTNVRLKFYGENYEQVVADHDKFDDQTWKKKLLLTTLLAIFLILVQETPGLLCRSNQQILIVRAGLKKQRPHQKGRLLLNLRSSKPINLNQVIIKVNSFREAWFILLKLPGDGLFFPICS